MTSLFSKIFDIRPGEGKRAFAMFAYIFLIIASLTIVKPVRVSLFLSEFGPERLPYGFMLVAAVSTLLVGFYTKLARSVKLNRLIAVTTASSILAILVVWLLLSLNFREAWFIYAFYVWVAVFGLLTTTQFWLLASYVFNAREAKRLFSFIGSGAIAGGIFGGYLTSILAPALNTRGMLHFCYLFLLACLAIQYFIWKHGARATYQERLRRQDRQREIQQQSSAVKLLFNSRLITYSAAIVGIGVAIGTLVDYQFSALASEKIKDQDELTAFFGFWFSNVSVLSLVIQLGFTNFVLRKAGVNGALMCLPIVVTLGAGVVMFAPLLLTATALKVGEGGLKQSLHKAGIELLGLPLPARLRNQVKALVDVAVDNLATGLTGLLILLLSLQLGLTARGISAVILVGSLGLIYVVHRVRKDYVDAFRKAIEKRAIRDEDISYEIFSTIRADFLIKLLNSGNDRQIVLALGYLENMKDPRLGEHLQRLAESNSSDVLRRVFRAGRSFQNVDLTARACYHIVSGTHEVRISAMRYMMSRSGEKLGSLRSWLEHEDVNVQAAAIEVSAREWANSSDFRKQVDISTLLASFCAGQTSSAKDSRIVCLALARAIGVAPRPEFLATLDSLLHSQHSDVRAAAALSAGRTRDRKYISALISLMAETATRRAAREALTEYGGDIAEILIAHFRNQRLPFRVRFEIPRVLSMIGGRECLTLLAEQLNEPDKTLRYEVLRSLNKIRTRDPELRIRSRILEPLVRSELRRYFETIIVLQTLDTHSSPNPAREFLKRALHEKREATLDKVFRILGLRHSPKDMYHAFLGVTGDVPDLRANAVELLDLVLQPNLKPLILPIADGADPDTQARLGAKLLDVQIENEKHAIQFLIAGNDDWLRACALYASIHIGMKVPESELSKYDDHENTVVREAVALVRRNNLTASGFQ